MDAVIDMLPEAAGIVSSDGCILTVNDDFACIFEYDRQELIGQKIEMLVPEVLRDQHVKWREAYMLKPEKRPFGKGNCFRGQTKSGTIVCLDVYLGPLPQNDVLLLIRDRKDLESIYDKIKILTERLDDLHVKNQ